MVRSILFCIPLTAMIASCAVAQKTQWTPVQATKARAAASAAFVWFEAENYSATNFPPADRHSFVPANEKEAAQLSGGKWVGAEGTRSQALFLEYDIDVPAPGTYQLYARKFWKHGPYRWRFGNGAWTNIGSGVALMDEAPLRQFLGANWTHAGEATLAKGTHKLRVELTSNEGAAAFDAFLLTTQPFIARGKMKPGEKYNRSEQGWFGFEPDADPSHASAIDLRSLNEKFAGEHGLIRVKGEDFVHTKNGQVVKFWAINTNNDVLSFDKSTIKNMARSWAKSGVNLVRLHGGPWGSDFRKVEPQHVQKLHYFIGALKAEGIYTCLSIYFPLWLNFDEKSGFAGYTGGKHPFALLFFNREFGDIYRGWWRTLLTSRDPSTGRTLAEDPALAMLEMVNEDSNLFWTFNHDNIPPPQMAMLEAQFGAWLAKKYGTADLALAAWGGAPVRGDDPKAGRIGFLPLYDVFAHKSQRGQDTAAFLTLNQKEFFDSTYKFLKTELGYKSTISGSNWITADGRILGPLDKWSNTGADFMDRHGYFDVGHQGERASYSISAGDKFEDRSALQFLPAKPGEAPNFNLPFFDIRYNGMPSTISEINWTPPNRLRADFPLVSAAYGSLQGTDAFFFFATGSPWWEQMIGKFSIRTPVTFGQFPATAYMFRKGLIKPGPVVVDANLSLERLFRLEGAPVSAPTSLDALREKDLPTARPTTVQTISAIDPLSFLVGKVAFQFVEKDTPSRVVDVAKFIDHKGKIVRSATGELSWDYGLGRVVVNAPGAQGVTGYLAGGGKVELGAISIDSPVEYGTVVVIAMDGKPISQSSKMLLQVMTEERNYGWQTTDGLPKEIVSVGSSPIMVRNISGTVSFKRRDAGKLKVTALDLNGYPVARASGVTRLELRPSTLYYLIER